MRICLIVAMAKNRIIGREGGMPWNLPGDLEYFKKMTLGKPVIMGRKTFESIGKPLPGRANIVISRNDSYSAEGVFVAASLPEALDRARKLGSADADEIMVIGGGQVYTEALSFAQRIYLTEIHASIDGDTVFPELSGNEWQEQSRQKGEGNNPDQPEISFVVLDRVHATD